MKGGCSRAAWRRPLEGRMDRPCRPIHRKGAEVAKHPTGVYLQGSWVQGEQASPFFFSFKKKGAKPLRAKSCPFGAIALRDAAAAAEMRPSGKDAGEFRPISALRASLRSVALRNAPAGAVRRTTRRCPPWTRTGLMSGDRKATRYWALGFGHGAAPAGAPDSPVHQWPGNRFALCSFGLQAPTKKPAHR